MKNKTSTATIIVKSSSTSINTNFPEFIAAAQEEVENNEIANQQITPPNTIPSDTNTPFESKDIKENLDLEALKERLTMKVDRVMKQIMAKLTPAKPNSGKRQRGPPESSSEQSSIMVATRSGGIKTYPQERRTRAPAPKRQKVGDGKISKICQALNPIKEVNSVNFNKEVNNTNEKTNKQIVADIEADSRFDSEHEISAQSSNQTSTSSFDITESSSPSE